MKSIYLHIQKTHQTLRPIIQRPHLDSYNQMKKSFENSIIEVTNPIEEINSNIRS